jgi:hypothetical protein
LGLVVRVKPLLAAVLATLTLALAALAFPPASAALPAGCTLSGGDTDCSAAAAGCAAHTHTYDVEDHPNVYEADCWGCGLHLGAGEPVRGDCYTPPPIGASASTSVPVTYQCSAAMESSFCTLAVGPCHETSGSSHSEEVDHAWRSAGCSLPVVGSCWAQSSDANAPTYGCENYGPGGSSASSAIAPPALPCQTGIAGTDCAVGALDCAVHVGYRTGSGSFEYVSLYCGPELWAPCTLAYADTTGQVYSCLVATASASPASSQSEPPCQTGFGASWCTVTAGPCRATVLYFSAWNDRWVKADCTEAGETCSAQAHTADLAHPTAGCGPAAAAASVAVAPPPCQSGFAQDWCDVNAGPCQVHAVTWTAWGDRWATADCAAAGTACHAEAFLPSLETAHSCAPTAAAESASAAPCTTSLPPHAGFDCTLGKVHCAVYIWLDLNPPNPTWDCLL